MMWSYWSQCVCSLETESTLTGSNSRIFCSQGAPTSEFPHITTSPKGFHLRQRMPPGRQQVSNPWDCRDVSHLNQKLLGKNSCCIAVSDSHSLFCSVDQCVCGCTDTMRLWLLWPQIMTWSQTPWYFKFPSFCSSGYKGLFLVPWAFFLIFYPFASKNAKGMLMEVALNLKIVLCAVTIFTMLILLTYEHGRSSIYYGLFQFLFKVLKFLL